MFRARVSERTRPDLKERIFGLSGAEGNHGGDAKEYWGISTPLTASRLAGAITIRRGQFPYALLRQENASRTLVEKSRFQRILARMLDESEFLSPYGLRSLSRYH